MRVVRVLVYEGDEAAVIAGLGCRAVRDERILGNGVVCREYVHGDGDWDAWEGSETDRVRALVAALPEPTRDTAIDPALRVIKAVD